MLFVFKFPFLKLWRFQFLASSTTLLCRVVPTATCHGTSLTPIHVMPSLRYKYVIILFYIIVFPLGSKHSVHYTMLATILHLIYYLNNTYRMFIIAR